MSSIDFSKLKPCTMMPVAPDMVSKAAAGAIKENPANAQAHSALLEQNGAGSFDDIDAPVYLCMATGKLWAPGRTLRVLLLPGASTFVQQKVTQYAQAWSAYANINLSFVTSGDAEIRVAFVQGQGSWSYIGTDNLTIAAANPTMNFGWFNDSTPDDEFSRTVIHEFGHAIGCVHEQSSPSANIQWNKPVVYAYYAQTQGWSQQQVDNNVLYVYSSDVTIYTNFDAQSIMEYPIPVDFTTNGFSVGWNKVLTDTDKAFATQMYPTALRLFHRGVSGGLWVAGATDIPQPFSGWKSDVFIPNVGIDNSPSPVWFRNRLYVFHAGGNGDTKLWFKMFDGTAWSVDQQVPNTCLNGRPSAVVYRDKLYVFHQGTQNVGWLWCNTFDGSNWSGDALVPNTGLSAGPSAVVFNDKIYVYHQGQSSNGWLWCNILDGSNWQGDKQVPNTGLSSGPSAVVYNGKVYCFHSGQNNTRDLWCNVFDGTNWAGDNKAPNTVISGSPGAIVVGNQVAAFHQGGDPTMWFNTFNGSSWGGDTRVPNVGTTDGPGVILT